MMKSLQIALIVLLPFLAGAQENKSFTVSGTALKLVNPNELHITAGVTTEGPNAEKLYETVSGIMAKAIAALKNKKGVQSLETDLVRINNAYGRSNPTFYNCTQTITIVLTDFALYDQLMLDLFAMGFNNINNVEFVVSNIATIKREVQIEAIKVAKEKAAVFAKELNVELGPVLSFSEQNNYSAYANTANYKTMDAGAPSGPSIAPNQVEVMMSVIVSFAFKTETK